MELNDLTFENIGDWPLPAKAAVIAFACAIIVVLGYWFLLKPQFKQLSQEEQLEIESRTKLEQKSGEAANLEVYRKQVVEVRKMLNTILYQLPEKTEVPNLLEDISKMGVASGLEFNLIKPEAEQKKDFYVELPIGISVMGTYHQMAEFVSSIANLQRIVTISDFSIEKTQQPTNTTLANQKTTEKPVALPPLTMTMTAKTYHYVGEAAPDKSNPAWNQMDVQKK